MPAVLSKFFVDDFEKFYERVRLGVVGNAIGDRNSDKWFMRKKYTKQHIRQVYEITKKQQYSGGWQSSKGEELAAHMFGDTYKHMLNEEDKKK
jgi:hypothetical protein